MKALNFRRVLAIAVAGFAMIACQFLDSSDCVVSVNSLETSGGSAIATDCPGKDTKYMISSASKSAWCDALQSSPQYSEIKKV